MSALKPGTLCVIIAGCPENIGLIVEVIAHLGPFEGKEDALHQDGDGQILPPGLGWQRPNSRELMVPATGFELVTYRLQGGCSTN